ncbi:MAG: hypothetical protein ACHQF0_00160 [Chitinophagales bacterium]
MKLHSEISIGWIIVYAGLLLSLSGKDSIQSARANIPLTDSISKGKLFKYFQDSTSDSRENAYLDMPETIKK